MQIIRNTLCGCSHPWTALRFLTERCSAKVKLETANMSGALPDLKRALKNAQDFILPKISRCLEEKFPCPWWLNWEASEPSLHCNLDSFTGKLPTSHTEAKHLLTSSMPFLKCFCKMVLNISPFKRWAKSLFQERENSVGRKKPVSVASLPTLLLNSSGLHPDQFLPVPESHLSDAVMLSPIASYFTSDE